MKKFLSLFPIIFLIVFGAYVYTYAPEKLDGAYHYVLSSIENINKKPKNVFHQAWRVVKNNYVDETYNHQDWNKWLARYDDDIKNHADSYVAIETMIESLNDPYSRFLSPEDFEEQHRNIDAKLYGIGVHITEKDGQIIIVNILEETPAEKADLKAKDIIIKVNNESVKGMSLKEVAQIVRGEAGTQVILTILRDKKEIIKNVLREVIKIKAVKYEILDNDYAYIQIFSFISNDTAYEVSKALDATENAKGIIIDLRGNHGGLLPNAVFISNMFIDKGVIVSIVDRTGKKQEIKAQASGKKTDKPLVVIINNESASASEILSGALKDHKRAELIGEVSFGKGRVQRILRMPDGSGINLTIAKYLTPNGVDIDHKGIKPDYEVLFSEKDFLEKKDPQLLKAKEVLALKIKNNKKLVSK